MIKKLGHRSQGGMVTEAIHCINALYLLGREPDARSLTRFSR